MERKSIQIQLKADRPGHLEAVFSRFGMKDHDGDVTLPTAFTPGETVRLLPAHDWAHYAIGKGAVRVDAEKAVFDGDFFLSTTAGRDWYESVKGLSDLQEFSYGFDILDWEPVEGGGRLLKKLKVHEVSPVTLGAGIGTGVLSLKDLKQMDPAAMRGHLSALRAMLDELPNDVATEMRDHLDAMAEMMRDMAGKAAEQAASAAGEPVGPAELRPFPNEHACRLKDPGDFQAGSFRRVSRESDGKRYDIIMGRLEGQTSMTEQAYRYPKDEWEADAARSHCESHDGTSFEAAGDSSARELDAASKSLGALIEELKEGRMFSSANVGRLRGIADDLEASAGKLRGILVDGEPPAKADAGAPSELGAIWEHLQRIDTYYGLQPAER